MRLKLERLKSWLKCPCKHETMRVLRPSDNFIISLQKLNKSMVISSKNLLSLVLWDWDLDTPALSRASASIRWWQLALSKAWDMGLRYLVLLIHGQSWMKISLLSVGRTCWISASESRWHNCGRPSESPAFRRQVFDIGHQWAEESCLALLLSGLQKMRASLYFHCLDYTLLQT